MNARVVGHAVRKLRNSLSARGVNGTLLVARERILKKKSLVGSRVKSHPFDAKYGVRTHGPIDLWKDENEMGQYDAVAPSLFHEACRRWRASLPADAGAIEDFTFIDLGAGQGRALLLASQLPFREVIGVELGESLVKVARRNIAKWISGGHAKCPVSIVHQDALTYKFPSGSLLVFLDNPFGERIMKQVLGRLVEVAQSQSQPVDIIYVYPRMAALLADTAIYQLLDKDRLLFDEVDKEADTFFRDGELCNWYRLVPRKSPLTPQASGLGDLPTYMA